MARSNSSCPLNPNARRLPVEWQQYELSPRPIGRGARTKPNNMAWLRQAITQLPPASDSCFHFTGHMSHIYLAARQIGAKVRVVKENGTGYTVWRAP